MRVAIQLPPDYRADLVGRTLLVAHDSARETAAAALAAEGTLFDWAAASSRRPPLAGRGPVHVVAAGRERWAVRRYRRGGAVARILGDLYLDRGVPRPARELLASEAAARRGVPTPPVRAFAIYPTGRFYRADLATRWVAGAVDLAALLFGDPRPQPARAAACSCAGRLMRLMFDRGVIHADLNLKNILVEWRPALEPCAHLLDLDRCRMVDRVSAADRQRMLRRFWRSAAKWERRTGRAFGDDERAAIDSALAEGTA